MNEVLRVVVFGIGACVLTGGLVAPVVRSAPMDLETHPAPGKYVWVGRQLMHIHCQGQGSPVVVFDSGLGGTSLDWSLVQPRVAKFTRACAYDRAGYGWSGRSPNPRTSESIVAELEKLLGFGGVAPPYVLVGHSFGGLNVRLFANAYPERIAGLVLVDSSHEEQFERFEKAGIKTPVPNRSNFVIGNHYRIPDGLPEDLRPVAQALALTPDAVGSLYSELRLMRYSSEQVRNARSLPDVPLVVIAHGSRDEARATKQALMATLWMAMQEDLADRTPHGRLVVASTAAHYVHLHQPELVVDAIRSVVELEREKQSQAVSSFETGSGR